MERDPEMALALLDQREAGKKLLLITNSDWAYTSRMMAHAFDAFLPKGVSWRDLFEIVILSARKPDFFTQQMPLFEVGDGGRAVAAVPGRDPQAWHLRRGRRRPGARSTWAFPARRSSTSATTSSWTCTCRRR